MNNAFEVYGGQRLKGSITPQGAKNEALQVICAVLLTPEKVSFKDSRISYIICDDHF